MFLVSFRLVAESEQPARPGWQCIAAYRAPRRVDSTSALCVKNRTDPETMAIIIIKKKAAVKANSRTAAPSSELSDIRIFIAPKAPCPDPALVHIAHLNARGEPKVKI